MEIDLSCFKLYYKSRCCPVKNTEHERYFFQKKLKPESSSRAFLKYPILDLQESFLLLISNRFEFYHRSPKKSLNNTFSLLKNERDI